MLLHAFGARELNYSIVTLRVEIYSSQHVIPIQFIDADDSGDHRVSVGLLLLTVQGGSREWARKDLPRSDSDIAHRSVLTPIASGPTIYHTPHTRPLHAIVTAFHWALLMASRHSYSVQHTSYHGLEPCTATSGRPHGMEVTPLGSLSRVYDLEELHSTSK